jgi:hypothetical protein
MLVSVVASAQNTGGTKELIHYWIPRAADVQPGSPEYAKLEFLLQHAVTRPYPVKDHDTLDSIIDTQFRVSGGPNGQKNAFGLYTKRIQELNRPLNLSSGSLTLPEGPIYSLYVGRASLPSLKPAEVEELKTSAPYMTVLRSGLGKGPAAAVHAASFENIARWYKVYLAGANNPDPIQSRRDALQDIAQNLIAPPTEKVKLFLKGLYYNPLRIQADPAECQNAGLTCFERFMPTSTGSCDTCSGNFKADCKKPLDLLGLDPKAAPPPAPHGRLLIADSGLVAALWPPGGKPLYGERNDLASNYHGSFVYSEVAATPQFGLIPPNLIDIGNIAAKGRSGDYDFQALQESVVLFRKCPHTTMSVVNLSAAASVAAALRNAVPWLFAQNTLFVLAAGNNCAGGQNADGWLFATQNFYDKPYLVVGAIGADQKSKAVYSNVSSTHVDLFAQGSCLCGYGSAFLNGTSQAAPLVSLAALLVSDRHSTFDPLDVKWRLISSSDLDNPDYAFNNSVGGALNTQRALDDKLIVRLANGAQPSGWQEAKAISTSDPGLQKALGMMSAQSPKVLRFRQVPCDDTEFDGQVCFQRFQHSRKPEPEYPLKGSDALSIELPQGLISIKLADLKDLQLPIKQNRSQTRIASCKEGEGNCF